MTLPSDKTNMRLWVAALRSRVYEQGKEHLRKGGKYCCLGVACEVALAAGVRLTVKNTLGDATSYNGRLSYLPAEMTQWLGVECDADGDVHVTPEECLTATSANDTLGWSFERIADELEKTYGLTQEEQ
jgi:hypothetical protein